MLSRLSTMACNGSGGVKLLGLRNIHISRQKLAQGFGKRSGNFARAPRDVTKRTWKEIVFAPAGPGAFNIGRGFVIGASALGLGSLCYYGLGMSKEIGTVDQMAFWPKYVKDRVKHTYAYFAGGLGCTAVSAIVASRSAFVMRFMSRGGFVPFVISMAAIIGSGMFVRSIPYEPGLGLKQVFFLAHAGIIGAVLAPMTMLGGPLLIRAAWMTAGICGGLSAIALCAPDEKFLNYGGVLGMGLGTLIVANIASIFVAPTTALGAGLYSVVMYGGLVLFGGFMLYDTQKIMKKAETYPISTYDPSTKRLLVFDPINASIGIYLDAINIFIRVAMMMSGSRRK